MNLQTLIEGAGSGSAVSQMARQLGLDQSQASSAISALLPAISGGMQKNVSSGGLQGLVGALASGRHQQWLDKPSELGGAANITDGNAILGHLLGSKDVSRQVAARASEQTGVPPDTLKKMLPMLATMAMGALSQKTDGGQTLQQSSGSPAMDMLSGLLDSDKDGSVVDDLLNLGKKLF